MLRSRVAEHRGYVSRGETDQPTSAHLSKPGHSLADLRVSVIEHTSGRGTEYRTGFMANKQFRMEKQLGTSVCADISHYVFKNQYVKFFIGKNHSKKLFG